MGFDIKSFPALTPMTLDATYVAEWVNICLQAARLEQTLEAAYAAEKRAEARAEAIRAAEEKGAALRGANWNKPSRYDFEEVDGWDFLGNEWRNGEILPPRPYTRNVSDPDATVGFAPPDHQWEEAETRAGDRTALCEFTAREGRDLDDEPAPAVVDFGEEEEDFNVFDLLGDDEGKEPD